MWRLGDECFLEVNCEGDSQIGIEGSVTWLQSHADRFFTLKSCHPEFLCVEKSRFPFRSFRTYYKRGASRKQGC